jgi:hypothetical protein
MHKEMIITLRCEAWKTNMATQLECHLLIKPEQSFSLLSCPKATSLVYTWERVTLLLAAVLRWTET